MSTHIRVAMERIQEAGKRGDWEEKMTTSSLEETERT